MIPKALTLENFKGIREPVRIEFAPLTLLFGPNNAGKSTIVQALMYAREVLERNNCDAGRTALGGDIVDLGGFASLVHSHDLTRGIRMRFELGVSLGVLATYIDADGLGDSSEDEDLESDESKTHVNLSAFTEARFPSTDVWVELEIAALRIRSHSLPHTTTVKRYCVGAGHNKYAEISVNERSGQAELSFLDATMFPVAAARYQQGEQSEFEWDLARIARAKLRQAIERGPAKIGLRKGATVAMPGEVLKPRDNKLSREDFDTRILQIVNGEGLWGDDTLDPETGEQNPKYRTRRELVSLAEASGRVRTLMLQWDAEEKNSEPPRGSEEWIEWLLLANEPPDLEDTSLLKSSGLLQPYQVLATEEIDGPLPIPTPLTVRGTALPEWNQSLEPFQEYEEETEECLRFLTPFISRPGKLILDALKDAVYLGPNRRLPSRHYRLQDAPAAQDWASGLAAWYLLTDEGNQLLVDRVNRWLSWSNVGFGTDYAVMVHRYKSLDLNSALWHDLTSGDLSLLAESIRERLADLPQETKKLELCNVKTGVAFAPQDLGIGIPNSSRFSLRRLTTSRTLSLSRSLNRTFIRRFRSCSQTYSSHRPRRTRMRCS